MCVCSRILKGPIFFIDLCRRHYFQRSYQSFSKIFLYFFLIHFYPRKFHPRLLLAKSYIFFFSLPPPPSFSLQSWLRSFTLFCTKRFLLQLFPFPHLLHLCSPPIHPGCRICDARVKHVWMMNNLYVYLEPDFFFKLFFILFVRFIRNFEFIFIRPISSYFSYKNFYLTVLSIFFQH